MSVFCHELTVVVVAVMFLLEGGFLEGSRGSKEEEEEVNHCKEQGGEERVAVAVLCFQIFDFKSGIEVSTS